MLLAATAPTAGVAARPMGLAMNPPPTPPSRPWRPSPTCCDAGLAIWAVARRSPTPTRRAPRPRGPTPSSDARAAAIGTNSPARHRPATAPPWCSRPASDFISAFFGCLYAGVVPFRPRFPSPPSVAAARRHCRRLRGGGDPHHGCRAGNRPTRSAVAGCARCTLDRRRRPFPTRPAEIHPAGRDDLAFLQIHVRVDL